MDAGFLLVTCSTHTIHVYGRFTYIYHEKQPNVSKYTVHGRDHCWSIIFSKSRRNEVFGWIPDSFQIRKGSLWTDCIPKSTNLKIPIWITVQPPWPTSMIQYPYHLWYIYLHEWWMFLVNVGKYTTPMDPMGHGRPLSQVVPHQGTTMRESWGSLPQHQPHIAT